MGAGPEWENQRKGESEESSKPGKVVPTGLAQITGSGGKCSGRGVQWYGGLSRRRDKGHLGLCPSYQETVEGRAEARAVRVGEEGFLSRHPRGLVLQDKVDLTGSVGVELIVFFCRKGGGLCHPPCRVLHVG